MNEYDLLPKSIQQLADTIGLGGSLLIVKAYRNSVLHVPNGQPGTELIKLLGIETAALFVQEYRRVSLPIPKCQTLFNYWRNLEMLKLKNEGKSILELCVLYSLSRRRVSKCLADARVVGESLDQLGLGEI